MVRIRKKPGLSYKELSEGNPGRDSTLGSTIEGHGRWNNELGDKESTKWMKWWIWQSYSKSLYCISHDIDR